MEFYPSKDASATQKVLLTSSFLDLKLTSMTVSPPTTEVPLRNPSSSLVLHSEGSAPIVGTASTLCRFLCSLRPAASLLGSALNGAARVDMWLDYIGQIDSQFLSKSNVKGVDKALKPFDDFLATHTYLGENRLSLADIVLSASLASAANGGFLYEKNLADLHHLKRLFKTVSGRAEFAAVIPKITFKQPPVEKPASDPAPKKAVVEKKEEQEEEEEMEAPVRSYMDEWKVCYSNTKELETVALKWFLETIDLTQYSLWYMKYDKLDDECKVGFLTRNQTKGFIQRVDNDFRKTSFGVILILGDEGELDIEAVWLSTGTEFPALLAEHPSHEYHTWRKMDIVASADDKKLLHDYWCNLEIALNRPIYDRFVWK